MPPPSTDAFASNIEEKIAVVRTAMKKLGDYSDVEIVISETGWVGDPCESGPKSQNFVKMQETYMRSLLQQPRCSNNLLYKAKTVISQLQDQPGKVGWGMHAGEAEDMIREVANVEVR